jgi:diguanylate cyclase (GGDEF)-like protein
MKIDQRSGTKRRLTLFIYLLLLSNMIILVFLNQDLFTRYQHISKSNITHYAEKIQSEVEFYLESAVVCDGLMIELWNTQLDFYEEALRHEKTISRLILSFDQIDAIRYGDEQGNYVYYQKIDQVTVNTKVIIREGDDVTTTLREFKGNQLQLIKSLKGADYDPREAPWYKRDLKRALTIIDPYSFFESEKEGISLSRQIIANNELWGNYGIDIGLDIIKDFLILEQNGRDYSSRLETQNGILVAESIEQQSIASYGTIEVLRMDDHESAIEVEEGIYVVKKRILARLSNPLSLVIVANYKSYLKSVRWNQLIILSTIIILIILFLNSILMNWYHQKSRKNLIEIATKDELTGLSNRHVFMSKFQERKEIAQTTNEPFSILLCDIDHFKKVNDTHGHNNGDVVLQKITELFQKIARSSDEVFRWGGEEFLVVLSNTSVESAINTAERIRSEIEKTTVRIGKVSIKCTVSFGVCEYEEGMDEKELVKLADDQLYHAKRQGRNRVRAHKRTCSRRLDK